MGDGELDELTKRVIGIAYEVSNILGSGFVEKVYENSFFHLLRKNKIDVIQQYPIKVLFDGVIVGEFYADLLVEGKVLIELKAVSELTDEHLAQALNYLRATGFPTGLLINFGKPKIQIRRLYPSPNWKKNK